MNNKTWQRLVIASLITACVVLAIAIFVFGRPINIPPEDVFAENPTTTTEPIITTTSPPTTPQALDDPEDTLRWDDDNLVEPADPRPRSLLTGRPIDEEYLNRRPIAVVINNIHDAQPQSGIASADIIYEVLAEGNITRLVAVFQSYMPEKIGPVRSARDYFIDMSFNHDAIFIHHGTSPTGRTRINNTRITALDGMALENSVFWRDRTYPEWHRNSGTRPMEHSSYVGWSRIENHMVSRNIRNYVNETHDFNFGILPPNLGINTANQITVPFSPTYVRSFVFDAETGLYMVEDLNGPHLDAADAAQVAVANVLVQFTTIRVVDNEGRRNVQTVGEGSGYLATDGVFVNVRWIKESHTSPMRWYFEDGSPIVLSPGSTWINVLQTTGQVVFE